MSLISDELAVVFLRNRATRRKGDKPESEQTKRNNRARREIEYRREMKAIDDMFTL